MSGFREQHGSPRKTLTTINHSTTSLPFAVKPEPLTELERLQLANQYSIREKLDFRNAKFWATCRKTLVEGHTFFYSKSFDPICWQQLDYEKCLYVLNAVDMCDALHRSFEGITDKAGITEEAVPHFLCFVDRINQESNRFGVLLSSAA
jgi:uncharacterized protein YfbU (UPF0304 family)